VYRLLKGKGLIELQPIPDLPAANEWHTKTRKVDIIWQCDATHYFVVGWGYYKQITVIDDHSRYPLAWGLRPNETAFSISDVVEKAIEYAQAQGHLVDGIVRYCFQIMDLVLLRRYWHFTFQFTVSNTSSGVRIIPRLRGR